MDAQCLTGRPVNHCLKLFCDPDIQLNNPLVGLPLAPFPASDGEHAVCFGLIESREQLGLEIGCHGGD